MKIDDSLAKTIAHLAVVEPYRQRDVITTGECASWLKQRGIDIKWETLHHLWDIGLLHPIAVLEPAAEGSAAATDRFVPIDLHARASTFVDLGLSVGQEVALSPPEDLPGELAEALLWHPFQLWSFSSLADILRVDMTLDYALYTEESCAKGVGSVVGNIHDRVVTFGSSDLQHDFLRILALLLGAEPLVHLALDTNITYRPRAGESFEDYFRWRDTQDGARLLSDLALPLDGVVAWHERLARTAHHRDPQVFMRELLRYIDPSKRALFKGDALLANDLYESSEILRRYLERFHAGIVAARPSPLPEENTVGFMQSVEEARQLNEFSVGEPRTADYNRSVLRRLLRQYQLDPQPRLTWFVEGDTEEAFIKHYAALRHFDLGIAGIEVMNVKGVGGVKSERFRPLLERLQREECFVCVTIDDDGDPSNRELFGAYVRDKLINTEWRVWEPNFAEANYSVNELAQIAVQHAKPLPGKARYPFSLTADEIEAELQERREQERQRGRGKAWTVERALEVVLRRDKGHALDKGAALGEALATWAFTSDGPAVKVEEGNKRPIVALFDRLLGATTSSYHVSIQQQVIDENGRRCPPRR